MILSEIFNILFNLLFKVQEGVESLCQRWFFGGKLLGDKLTVEDSRVQPGYVVQVIINTEMLRNRPS